MTLERDDQEGPIAGVLGGLCMNSLAAGQFMDEGAGGGVLAACHQVD